MAPESRTIRICTVGSVDDGKSTLLGRLLLDCKALLADHYAQVEEASRRRGAATIDLALVTDGLRAEREQGITIDVAWRYLATSTHRFILADTPGHVQYTRNMLTGASTSDAVLLLVDAHRGLTAQSRRHLAMASLLGVDALVVCVNKMDAVDFSQRRFDELRAEVHGLLARFARRTVQFIPISALQGDNVVERSPKMAWYVGAPVLATLGALATERGGDHRPELLRLPIQWVTRAQGDGVDVRGWAGRVERGLLRVGDAVTLLPSGVATRVERLTVRGQPVEEASRGETVLVELQDDVDGSRGDVLVATAGQRPQVSQRVEADLFWLAAEPPRVGGGYIAKQLTLRAKARLAAIHDRLDVATLGRQPTDVLALNDVGRVTLHQARPFVWDPYDVDRRTGSFILIDETSGDTVGAGLLRRELA
jgi:bifunctional enzyme CysN/CysC